ncbi:MAG: YfcE family phosphodiesterase [Thermodesulfobacteriota bacterium]|nr:YfcE family phosphodiesterase [Thermodesulfobacteriota bacterium]
MLIAVMSDSHDHIWNLQKALGFIKERDAGMIIHCGDFVAPFMLKELEGAGVPVHGVFGNNDGDQYLLTKFSLTVFSHITLHGIIGQVDIDEFTIGFTHQGMVAEGLAAGGKYQMVCFGHSHEYLLKNIGQTILLNPGEIMGKEGSPGFCLVNTKTKKVERVELAG